MKYIAIYQEGVHVVKPDLDSVFSLPGNYYVFSIGETFDINIDTGTQFLDKNKTPNRFKINNLELIKIEKLSNNFSQFAFSIYDQETDSPKKVSYQNIIFEYALDRIVKTIIKASKFPNWESYESISKTEEYKSEISVLKLQLQKEKEEIEKLNKEIQSLKKKNED